MMNGSTTHAGEAKASIILVANLDSIIGDQSKPSLGSRIENVVLLCMAYKCIYVYPTYGLP